MAVKSIIDVDVNDDAFTRFRAAYDQYSASLAKAPDAWAKVSAATEISAAALGVIVGQFSEMLILSRERGGHEESTSKELKRQSEESDRQAKSWKEMARDTKNFAANIASATVSLLEWASVTGIVTGLIGGGGLFGIDRLAQNVSGQRKLATGTGTTIGERSAFESDFSRLLDNPSGFLTGVFESQVDVTKAAPYGALGLDYGSARAKPAADAALDILKGLKTLADRTPEEQLGTTFASRQLSMLGLTLEDFQRIKQRPLSELNEYSNKFRQDRGGLNINDPVAKAWEDLTAQLKRAGSEIEKVFVVGLTPLIEPLSGLSAAVVHLLKDFLEGGEAKSAIDALKRGIDWLDKTIGDPAFEGHVEKFVENVEDMALAVGHAFETIVGWVKWFTGTDDDKKDGAKGPSWRFYSQDDIEKERQKRAGKSGGSPDGSPSDPYPMMPGEGSGFSPMSFRPGAGASPEVTGARVKEAHDFFRAAGWTEAQTAGLLGNIGVESGFNPQAVDPIQGFQGLVQWDQGRRALFHQMFGHDPVNGTFEEQLWFIQWELTNSERPAGEKLRRLGRDAVSAADVVDESYERSAGTTRLQRERGASQYMQQFKDRSVRVNITNNTGGSVNVTAAQMTA